MAEAFDLILSEYSGYTDEALLELPLGRILQMVKVIHRRRVRNVTADLKFQMKLAETHARTLIGGLAPLAQTTEAYEIMCKHADVLRFDGSGKPEDAKPQKKIPTIAEVSRVFGVGSGGLVGARG
jgi:hypothetical protein